VANPDERRSTLLESVLLSVDQAKPLSGEEPLDAVSARYDGWPSRQGPTASW
jgi:hypothetical protein